MILEDKSFLLFLLAEKRRVLSSSVLNGGFGEAITFVLNYDEKDKNGRCEMTEATYEKHLEAVARRLSFDPVKTTILSTAASMKNVSMKEAYFPLMNGDQGYVFVMITGGIDKNGRCAGDHCDWSEENGVFYKEDHRPQAGTINIFLYTDVVLTESAMLKASMTLTEAKSAAIRDLHLESLYSSHLATGSGTDGFVIISKAEGEHTLSQAGTDSSFGALIGRLVKEALKEALYKQTRVNESYMHHAGRRLARFGFVSKLEDEILSESSAVCLAIMWEGLLTDLLTGMVSGEELITMMKRQGEGKNCFEKELYDFLSGYLNHM